MSAVFLIREIEILQGIVTIINITEMDCYSFGNKLFTIIKILNNNINFFTEKSYKLSEYNYETIHHHF